MLIDIWKLSSVADSEMNSNGAFSSPHMFTTLSMNKACLAVIFKLKE